MEEFIFRKYSYRLLQAIIDNPIQISWQLFAARVIGNTVLNRVITTTGASAGTLASDLLNGVLSNIRTSPASFEVLLRTLTDHHVAGPIVAEMEKEYGEQRREISRNRPTSIQLLPSPANEISSTGMQLGTPDTPSSTGSRYSTSSLGSPLFQGSYSQPANVFEAPIQAAVINVPESVRLEVFDPMMGKIANLVKEVMDAIPENRILDLKQDILLQRPFLRPELDEAKTRHDIAFIIRCQCTVTNYGLLTYLSQSLNIEKVSSAVNSYTTASEALRTKLLDKEFCKKVEAEAKLVQSRFLSPRSIHLKVKWAREKAMLQEFEELMRLIFDSLADYLFLKAVNEGCMTFLLYAPAELQGALVRMSSERVEEAKQHGVVLITVSDVTILDVVDEQVKTVEEVQLDEGVEETSQPQEDGGEKDAQLCAALEVQMQLQAENKQLKIQLEDQETEFKEKRKAIEEKKDELLQLLLINDDKLQRALNPESSHRTMVRRMSVHLDDKEELLKEREKQISELRTLLHSKESELQATKKLGSGYPIQKESNGVYSISYISPCKNAHKLVIKEGEREAHSLIIHPSPLDSRRIVHVVEDDSLRWPWGVAVTTKGMIVAVENGPCCISIFSKALQKMYSFCGPANSPLHEPRGIAISADGYIYVVDGGNSRIVKFTMEGELVKAVGQNGSGPLEFNQPFGIAIHPHDGTIFIADSGNKRINVLNQDMTHSYSFGNGSQQPRLHSPWDVAFDSEGMVYVADSQNHCICKFTKDGHLETKFGKNKGEQLQFPSGIAVSKDGKIYVAERDRHCVSLFDQDEKYVRSFGVRGSKIGEFEYPRGLTVDSLGYLLVTDHANHRIQIF